VDLFTKEVTVATPSADVKANLTFFKNSIGMQFVLVPAGEAMLESADPNAVSKGEKGQVDKAVIEHPFFMGTYAVSFGEWGELLYHNPPVEGGVGFPVGGIPASYAMKFCVCLSARDGVTYRLPTTAEWEYACKAGSQTRYYFGDDLRADCVYAGGARGLTVPNRYGLYDMIAGYRQLYQATPKVFAWQYGHRELTLVSPGVMPLYGCGTDVFRVMVPTNE
jgi:formylglycine-generating enzyme required for sulfatase activity